MNKDVSKVIDELVRSEEMADEAELQRVLDSFLARKTISRKVRDISDDNRTFGERAADRVAAFGGSWTFLLVFTLVLVSWVVLNSYVLAARGAFDPYPYILLNLFLSMLAAVQAPVILMSQNRQAANDRVAAQHDYEVNLKSELEVRLLHEKLDELRERKWLELMEIQARQLDLIKELVGAKK